MIYYNTIKIFLLKTNNRVCIFFKTKLECIKLKTCGNRNLYKEMEMKCFVLRGYSREKCKLKD